MKSSHAISSSRRRQSATLPVNIVQEKSATSTWNSASSPVSWTSVTTTGPGAFHFTYSESPSSTRESWKQSIILRPRTSDIRFFLQLMERSLTSLQGGYWKVELTESYGLGGGSQFRFQPKQWKSSKESVWSGFSLKKPRKKSLRSGRRFQGSR